MPPTMTAVLQDALGGPEVLHLGTIDRPAPGIGEILVRVGAAGVNPADEMNRRTGVFSGPPPFVLGWDVAGAVAAVGPGVTIVGPGDEVFGLLPFPRGAGAYAEYVVGPARAFVPRPTDLTDVEAAALPLAGLTAWQALVETAHVKAGERVVVVGAAGGVGHLAVQIAAARGAEVVAVASGANEAFVRRLGAADVLDRRTVDWTQADLKADVVFDTVGADPGAGLRALRRRGVLVSALPQGIPAIAEAARDLGVRATGLFVESDRLGLAALTDLVADGALRPAIAAVHPFADAALAHSAPHGPGKVVLVPGSPE